MTSWVDERVKIIDPPQLVKYQGVYDLARLLKEIHAWLKKTGYFIKYKDQTETPKPQGKDVRYELICDRQPTPYFKFYIVFEIIGRNNSEVVVEENGKKKVKVMGDIELYVNSYVDKNYNRQFPKTKFGQLCRRLYERYATYRKMQAYYGKLYGETMEVLEVIKGVLDAFRT